MSKLHALLEKWLHRKDWDKKPAYINITKSLGNEFLKGLEAGMRDAEFSSERKEN